MQALAVHYRRLSNKARISTAAHESVRGQHRGDGNEKAAPEGKEKVKAVAGEPRLSHVTAACGRLARSPSWY
jgi:hypothetical protein